MSRQLEFPAVVISGTGIVTPDTVGDAETWSLCTAPKPPAPAPTPKQPKSGVEVPGPARQVPWRLPLDKELPPKALRKISDHSRLVTLATHLALGTAGLGTDAADGEGEAPETNRDDVGILLGTSFGCASYHLEYHEALRRKGVMGASALLFTQSVFNAATGHVGQLFGMRGSNLTFVGGEAIGLEAITRAVARVQLGTDTTLLAGGADQYDPLVHLSLVQSGLLTGSAAGGVLCEGAALVVVEREATAKARGTDPLARVLGTGHTRGVPIADGCRLAAGAALRRAGLPEDAGFDAVLGAPAASSEAATHVEAFAEIAAASPLALPWVGVGEGFGFTGAAAAWAGARALHHGQVPASHVPDQALPAELSDKCSATSTPLSGETGRVLVLATTPLGSVSALLLGACG